MTLSRPPSLKKLQQLLKEEAFLTEFTLLYSSSNTGNSLSGTKIEKNMAHYLLLLRST
jgi:hypothetical protein